MSVVRHMIYGAFGTHNTMVAFIFRIDPRKGQYKVKLCQKGQIFKIKKQTSKTCLSCQVLSQNSKKSVIYFYVRQLKMPRIVFQKSHVITFSLGFCQLHRQIERYCLDIWYVCRLNVAFQNVFCFFFIIPPFWSL